jgi:hypothetical protein
MWLYNKESLYSKKTNNNCKSGYTSQNVASKSFFVSKLVTGYGKFTDMKNEMTVEIPMAQIMSLSLCVQLSTELSGNSDISDEVLEIQLHAVEL